VSDYGVGNDGCPSGIAKAPEWVEGESVCRQEIRATQWERDERSMPESDLQAAAGSKLCSNQTQTRHDEEVNVNTKRL
jgi:hypothetical protein